MLASPLLVIRGIDSQLNVWLPVQMIFKELLNNLESTAGRWEQTEDATINRAFWKLDKAVGK
jgi:hypothetical protein